MRDQGTEERSFFSIDSLPVPDSSRSQAAQRPPWRRNVAHSSLNIANPGRSRRRSPTFLSWMPRVSTSRPGSLIESGLSSFSRIKTAQATPRQAESFSSSRRSRSRISAQGTAHVVCVSTVQANRRHRLSSSERKGRVRLGCASTTISGRFRRVRARTISAKVSSIWRRERPTPAILYTSGILVTSNSRPLLAGDQEKRSATDLKYSLGKR